MRFGESLTSCGENIFVSVGEGELTVTSIAKRWAMTDYGTNRRNVEQLFSDFERFMANHSIEPISLIHIDGLPFVTRGEVVTLRAKDEGLSINESLLVPYDRIIDASVKEELIEETRTKTVKDNALGRAALGHLLLGAEGALVGAMTAGTKTVAEKKVKGKIVYSILEFRWEDGIRTARFLVDPRYSTLRSVIRFNKVLSVMKAGTVFASES